jgi:hypothetical protein
MMKNRVSMMHQETSTRLHGITTQKTVLFKWLALSIWCRKQLLLPQLSLFIDFYTH